jgi:DNA primase
VTFVDDLEASIDIVELVWRYTKLKKAGTNYKALCPFPGHSEKTPSFVASPVKQIWYCFGCHKWGWPVKFIMDMENCEFREALQVLWNITGTEIPGYTENKEQIEIKKNLYSLYKDATNYYKQALSKNPEVKKYLMDRGLSDDDIAKFHFWYADSWVSLYNYLKEKWYEDDLISQSQIFLNVKARKDKFIGRVIFPIQNLRWDFVAFAWRIIGKWEPKYLNSPASDIYDKSNILYGLYDARTTITKVDHIIITEWYMDTIALHRAWFFQSVAVSGTALTEKHITIIKRLTHKIYLCFDNDKAWEQATRNSLEILKNKWLEVRVIKLIWGKDPDECLEAWQDFQKLIDSALSPIAFLIEKNNYDMSSIDEKKKFIAEVLDIIRNYSDSIEQDTYLKELAQISDTPKSILYELFKKTKAAKAHPIDESIAPTENITTPEDIIIGILYEDAWKKSQIQESIIFPEWISDKLQQVFNNPAAYFKSLDLERTQKYKALAFTFSNNAQSEQDSEKELTWAIHWLNRYYYKSLSESYKTAMNWWDNDALMKYSRLLQIAKKHQIK